MPFAWQEYLQLAQLLQTQPSPNISQEAFYRCAISRAYYAAFCHARNYARDRHNLTLSYTADDHSLVRRHFRARKERGIVPKLDDLRQWRNLCDYEDSIQNLDTLLVSAMSEANKVIAILK
jgi:uncharacterized protein (UPF0332 family)